jgi:tRNA A-37 threonylcarbamoyl transferase component Bud32
VSHTHTYFPSHQFYLRQEKIHKKIRLKRKTEEKTIFHKIKDSAKLQTPSIVDVVSLTLECYHILGSLKQVNEPQIEGELKTSFLFSFNDVKKELLSG